MTDSSEQPIDPSPDPSTAESYWGLCLFLLLGLVVFFIIFGDYGSRPEPKSKPTAIKAVSRR